MSEPSPLPDGADEHTEVLDDHDEHTPGVTLAGEVIVTRHADGLTTITIDGVDFPWFISADPSMEFMVPTEERPYPVLLLPVLCASLEVLDAVAPGEDEPLEGVVVEHPREDPAP